MEILDGIYGRFISIKCFDQAFYTQPLVREAGDEKYLGNEYPLQSSVLEDTPYRERERKVREELWERSAPKYIYEMRAHKLRELN